MSDPVEPLPAGLQDRYAFERELGRGGMATVWRARDLRHDRPVALKVLHPEVAASLGAERFQGEIRLAARLQHPHILSVFDSGAVRRPDGVGLTDILWFTMPFVDGESLRDRLNRERQLPLEDALRIAREAADALEHAHREGIIHRDIKPENILLTGSRTRDRGDGWHALVSDFGIARALAGAGDARLTETGLTLGTPAYMSPEQAAGDRSLDARTDIYSLGTVTYEMLAGEPPFSAPTTQAMIARRFTESPRPLRELRDTVPEAVEQAVAKALARSAADRFGSAAELARALEKVTARSSSAQYKGTSKSPAEIGRELGVDYLLTGTVRWEKGANGSRVRVSPELIQVSTGSTRWQEPFDAALTDVFQVQADVAGRVAGALNLALGAGERERLAEKPTQSLTAYDAYLKGEEASDAMGTSDVASLRQAIEHYAAAVAVDSSFSLAWARIGQTHASLYFL